MYEGCGWKISCGQTPFFFIFRESPFFINAMPFELSVDDCSLEMWSIGNHSFHSPLKGVGGVEPYSSAIFPPAERPLCALVRQQQDARCTTTYTWWWRLVGHEYSSIIIGLYDPSFRYRHSSFSKIFLFILFSLFF